MSGRKGWIGNEQQREADMSMKSGGERVSLSDPGRKPEPKWIALDKLYVDHNYQRNTKSKASQRNLESMKIDFRWVFCGALMVCWVASQKKYAVIDGQHRLEAARWRGDIDELPCLIISELDVEK